jgi:hypothetical protein
MVDYSNQLFNYLAENYKGNIIVQNIQIPSSFPTVTIDETSNIDVDLDSDSAKYARVEYRVQVFTTGDSKRTDARDIFSQIDTLLQKYLRKISYTTTPEIYNSDVYCIEVTYRGVVDSNGTFYKGDE